MRQFRINSKKIKRKLTIAHFAWFVLASLIAYGNDQNITTGEVLISLLVIFVFDLMAYVELRRTVTNIQFTDRELIVEYPFRRETVEIKQSQIRKIYRIRHSERDFKPDGGVRIVTGQGEFDIYWEYLEDVPQIKSLMNGICPISKTNS